MAKNPEFASKLKAAMRAKRLRPGELALASGISPSQLSRYLGGQVPDPVNMARLVKPLGIDPASFMFESTPTVDAVEEQRKEAIHLLLDADPTKVAAILGCLRGDTPTRSGGPSPLKDRP